MGPCIQRAVIRAFGGLLTSRDLGFKSPWFLYRASPGSPFLQRLPILGPLPASLSLSVSSSSSPLPPSQILTVFFFSQPPFSLSLPLSLRLLPALSLSPHHSARVFRFFLPSVSPFSHSSSSSSSSLSLSHNLSSSRVSSSSSSTMRHLTKLGLVLSIIFLVSFLMLVGELIYLLCYRRRSSHRQARDPTSKHLLLHILCWKNQSQVEPASSPRCEDEDMDQGMDKWERMHQSRLLFTINEGEKEGAESEGGSSRTAPLQSVTPFATPCGTPTFFTPPPSPPRDSSLYSSNC